MTDPVQRRAYLWVVSGDSGLSSKAIWAHMMGVEPRGGRFDHPHDPADLGRCLRLLCVVPEWRPRIGEMAARSSSWASLVTRWDDLEQTMAGEVGIDWSKGNCARRTYDLMHSLLNVAEAREGWR